MDASMTESGLLAQCVAELTAIAVIARGEEPAFPTPETQLAEIVRRADAIRVLVRDEHERWATNALENAADDGLTL